MSDTAALEAVARSVKDLGESVKGMQDNLIDKETVARIAADVLQNQREADRVQNRAGTGYRPSDELPGVPG